MNRVLMPVMTISAVGLGCLVQVDSAPAEVERWQFGGDAGHLWREFTDSAANVLMDDFTVPSALQPRELDPGVNFLTRLGPWHGVKFPKASVTGTDSLVSGGESTRWGTLRFFR